MKKKLGRKSKFYRSTNSHTHTHRCGSEWYFPLGTMIKIATGNFCSLRTNLMSAEYLHIKTYFLIYVYKTGHHISKLAEPSSNWMSIFGFVYLFCDKLTLMKAAVVKIHAMKKLWHLIWMFTNAIFHLNLSLTHSRHPSRH
jgi:hypothetical protein